MSRICSRGDSHILGDAAYPVLPWLLTPFRDNGHLSVKQAHYNNKQSVARCKIERAFALLKGRFRRLRRIDMFRTDKIPDVIAAACVIHNFSLRHDAIDNIDEYVSEG